MSPEAVYQLSQEYLDHAYRESNNVRDEEQLRDYRKLISMSVISLEYLKSNYSLSIGQDAKVTCRLAEILLSETLNFDLAETYLSSIRERLQYHQSSGINWPLFHEKMRCEFLALYVLPMKRDENFHYKIALRNCDEMVGFMTSWKHQSLLMRHWLLIFRYVNIWLNIKLHNVKRVLSQFNELSKANEGSLQWKAFITLCHLNFLLNERIPIPDSSRDQLASLKCDEIGARLYGWKLILELIILIYEDKNITDKLNAFKKLFTDHRDALGEDRESLKIQVGPDVYICIQLTSIFQYKDIKNFLLLLQSVSYLVNCHDKKANFSTKFLPKVFSTTKKLINTMNVTEPNSLAYYDSKVKYYQSIQGLAEFYQKWEHMLLTGEMPHATGAAHINQNYMALICAISSQMDLHKDDMQVCEKYSAVASSKSSSNEVKMISFLNSYVVRASIISNDIHKGEQLKYCNALWSEITRTLAESDLRSNSTWDCTVTILWIISHFEPFTKNPLSFSDDERTTYTGRLKNYYQANKTVETDKNADFDSDNKYKLKNSLSLRILLNYTGGRLFEQDLTVISRISEACFRLAKRQNVLEMEYVIGLWHLMNSTIAMNSKEVVVTTAKLDAIVEKLLLKDQILDKKCEV